MVPQSRRQPTSIRPLLKVSSATLSAQRTGRFVSRHAHRRVCDACARAAGGNRAAQVHLVCVRVPVLDVLLRRFAAAPARRVRQRRLLPSQTAGARRRSARLAACGSSSRGGIISSGWRRARATTRAANAATGGTPSRARSPRRNASRRNSRGVANVSAAERATTRLAADGGQAGLEACAPPEHRARVRLEPVPA